LERGTDNSYAFISLYGDKQFDNEGYFGKVCATKPVGKGFGLGGEATFGSGVDDLVRGMAVKNFTLGPVGGQIQLSPVSTEGLDPHAGLVLYGGKGKVNFGAWANLDDRVGGGTDFCGEVQATYDLSKKVQAIGRVDSYPHYSPGYWAGLQLELD
jgi:hypothetical protein